jgi:hypothetical protein
MIAIFYEDQDVAIEILRAIEKVRPIEFCVASTEEMAISMLREFKPETVICSTGLNVFQEAKRVTRGRVRLFALTDETGKIPRNQKVDGMFLRSPLPVGEIVKA